MPHRPQVGLAHDYLLVMRGAERTFAAMASCWPDAPIYTLLYDRKGTKGRFSGHPVHTSYLQRLQIRQGGFRYLLPLYPRAIEQLPIADHELVLSSSSTQRPPGRRRQSWSISQYLRPLKWKSVYSQARSPLKLITAQCPPADSVH